MKFLAKGCLTTVLILYTMKEVPAYFLLIFGSKMSLLVTCINGTTVWLNKGIMLQVVILLLQPVKTTENIPST